LNRLGKPCKWCSRRRRFQNPQAIVASVLLWLPSSSTSTKLTMSPAGLYATVVPASVKSRSVSNCPAFEGQLVVEDLHRKRVRCGVDRKRSGCIDILAASRRAGGVVVSNHTSVKRHEQSVIGSTDKSDFKVSSD
jgi:hypothetical protein